MTGAAYSSFANRVRDAIAPLVNEVSTYIAKKRYKILPTTIDVCFDACRAKADRPNGLQ